MSRPRSASTPIAPERKKFNINDPIMESIPSSDHVNSDSRASSNSLKDKYASPKASLTSFSANTKGPSAIRQDPTPRARPASAYASYEPPIIETEPTEVESEIPQKSFLLNSAKSFHYYSEQETCQCSDWINSVLQPHLDPDMAHLFPQKDPLPTTPGQECNEALFNACKDGVLLLKLINKTIPGAVDLKFMRRPPKNTAQMSENNQLMLKGAKAVGVKISNIGPEDIMKGTPHLTLSIIWQIIKIGLLSKINIQNNPDLQNLLTDSEKSNASSINNETLLMKWVNFHLVAAGTSRKISNFTSDLQDCEILGTLLHQLAPPKSSEAVEINRLYANLQRESSNANKAPLVITMTNALGVKPLMTAEDICKGNKEHAIAFCAQLFDKYPNLEEALSKHSANVQAEAQIKEAEDTKRLQDQIDKLIKEKGQLLKEIESLKRRIKEFEKVLSDTEVVMNNAEKATLASNARHDAVSKQNEALSASIKTINAELEDLKKKKTSELETFGRKIDEFQQQKANAAVKLATTFTEVEKLKRELQTKTDSDSKKSGDIEKLKGDLESMQKQNTAKNESMNKLSEEYNNLKQLLQATSGSESQKSAEIAKLQALLSASKEQNEKLDLALGDARNNIAQLNGSLKSDENTINNLQKSSLEMAEAIRLKDVSFKALDEKYTQLQQQYHNLETEKKNLAIASSSEIDKIQKTAQEAKETIEKQHLTISAQKENIQQDIAKIKALESDIQRKTGEIQAHAGTIVEMKASVSKLETEKKGLLSSIESLKQNMTSLDTQLAKRDNEIKKVKAELESANDEIADKDSENEALQTHNAGLEANLEAANQKLEKLLTEKHSLDQECQNMQHKIEDMTKQNHALVEDLTVTKHKLSEVEGINHQLLSGLKQAQDSAAAQQITLKEKDTFTTDLSRELRHAQTSLAETQRERDRLNQELAQRNEDIKNLESKNTSWDNQLNTKISELQKEKNKVGQLEAKASKLDSVMKQLHAQCESLRNELASKNADISEKAASLEKNNSHIKDLAQKVEKYETLSKSQEVALQTLQKDAEKLHHDLEASKKEVEKAQYERDGLLNEIKRIESHLQEVKASSHGQESLLKDQLVQLKNASEADSKALRDKIESMTEKTNKLLKAVDLYHSSLKPFCKGYPEESGDVVSAVQFGINTLLDKQDQMITSLQDQQKKLEALHNECEALKNARLPELQRKIELLEHADHQKASELDVLHKELNEKAIQLKVKESKIEEMQKFTEVVNKERDRGKEIERKWSQVTEHEIPLQKSRISQLEVQIKSKETELEYWKRTCNILQKDMDSRDKGNGEGLTDLATVQKLNDIARITKTLKQTMEDVKIRTKIELKPRDLEKNMLHKVEDVSHAVARLDTTSKTI